MRRPHHTVWVVLSLVLAVTGGRAALCWQGSIDINGFGGPFCMTQVWLVVEAP